MVSQVGPEERGRLALDAIDIDRRLADMDLAGIDVQVISPTPDYHSWTDASVLLGRAISDLPTRRQAPYTAWRRRQGTSSYP